MRTKSIVLSLIMIIVAAFSAHSQQTFRTTSKSVIAFYEYLPPDYSSNSNKYPVMIFLHGIGERGPNSTDPTVLDDHIAKVATHGPPSLVKNGMTFPFILISPQLKDNYGLWPSTYVYEVIEYVKQYLRIDERKIYLTGLSLGGGGAWVTAQDYPKLFAAVAPVCGGYNSPTKACGIAGENLPVWAFHGDKDSVVPYSKTVNMVNAINSCLPAPNPLARLTIYPGVGHNAWDNAYKPDNTVHNPNVYQWSMSKCNTVNAGNTIPIAKANSDQVKYLSSTSSTKIYGSAYDADGSIAAYEWTKISGPSATLSNTTSATLSLSGLKQGKYLFRLRVTDNSGNSDSDYVLITVYP